MFVIYVNIIIKVNCVCTSIIIIFVIYENKDVSVQ